MTAQLPTTPETTALTAAVIADHTDRTAQLVLADAAADAGAEYADALAAAEQIARQSRIDAITAALLAANVTAAEIWTLDRAKAAKGPAARTCERLLTPEAGGAVLVVVYTDDSLTASGLLASKTTRKTDVIHYRKSSGGRWGRSVAATRIHI